MPYRKLSRGPIFVIFTENWLTAKTRRKYDRTIIRDCTGQRNVKPSKWKRLPICEIDPLENFPLCGYTVIVNVGKNFAG